MPAFFQLPHIESCSKRVRALFGGEFVADSGNAKLVWEHAYYPVFYFPKDEVLQKYLKSGSDGTYDIVVGSKTARGAVKAFKDDSKLAGLLRVDFKAMDAWFEEDEQVFVHPKDPYKRVDVLQSSRHVRVEVNGVEVANSHRPRFLYETGLPVRTYIPKTDCRLDLLVPSELTTQCPYKGIANYYNVKTVPDEEPVKNVVWWYRNPNLECAAINGFVAFYDEKVDVWIDGEKQVDPRNK
ncbi:hypothetical protein E1B28_011134 [Marasmius oreades]|uniref:DUF427 domain-containing protein n=1 Tax=Marasmius oreades TaxID=181124 RepID=A0A9P7URR8_9AGAR|nr:uncharacterized protein E1B28_011134 [Marasmius oreades]KAG7089449.1 hypothetical protein E1B28_011134 [Marasmius oreades]